MSTLCKYYKLVKQVSYDSGQTWTNLDEYMQGDLYESGSTDCTTTGDTPTGETIQYRWVDLDPSTDYYCSGITKYYKQQKQISYDNGTTWENVVPSEYRTGEKIGVSTDCGYIPPSPTSGTYLTFVVVEPSSFSFSGTIGRAGTNLIQYSLDNGVTWSEPLNEVTTEVLPSGSKVMWKGNMHGNSHYVSSSVSYDGVGKFSSTGYFNLEGNIMSLIYSDNYSGTTIPNQTDIFYALFRGCSKLISAKNLALPNNTFQGCYNRMFSGCTSLIELPMLPTTELSPYCYVYMFSECTSLTDVPYNYLPLTSLEAWCYQSMFAGCTSLVNAPQLPATEPQAGCYYYMFYGCTSLTTAPVLPVRDACTQYCYAFMFYGCSSLNYIKCLATNDICNADISNWVTGVSKNGTFVKNSTTNEESWGRGDSGIPYGWTVENA